MTATPSHNTPQPALTLSLIVPVFNRPQEVEELLDSLTRQTRPDFEVVLVEDGSTQPCDAQVKQYEDQLSIQYLVKTNSGPGQSRNVGAKAAKGNYVVFLDSDCVVPPGYIEAVYHRLTTDYVDAFGGPDRADDRFTPMQKAINYAMTSFFTTGGIRGGGEKLDKFFPRSFNMGYSKTVFEQTGGFSAMRFGEDIDMSLRILKNGFKTALVTEAYVFHKRRSNLRQFYKQVFNSGIARIVLHKKHPGSLKAVHTFPALFVLGVLSMLLLGGLVHPLWASPLLAYILAVFLDATRQNHSLRIGCLAVVASLVQLGGYGLGFLSACWNILIIKRKDVFAFVDNFYA
ncbi:MAG: putative glycosyltransferase EpsJ [Bacteroidetes bacterium ADurb.Bin416]|nr:MAG: putative glycosyltransferase EpsJ [Bacteroidetes bacterium ADurb.Bin416]